MNKTKTRIEMKTINCIRILLFNLLIATVPTFIYSQHVYSLVECLEMAMQHYVRIK